MQEPSAVRGLTQQLAEDLAWLEEHARSQTEHRDRAAEIRLAAALVRNVLGPFVETPTDRPLHVAVVGGAGVGKSTVANMLCGAMAAESNPQAGFTRHPVAYLAAQADFPWPSNLGFLGPLQRLTRSEPSNLDSDVYQIRRVAVEDLGLLANFAVWDCPDMTTAASEHYVPRLLEVAGLADVLVYVASDERYNDEVPTEYLRQLLALGKSVIVCLVKMKEADAPAFVQHFQKEVMGRMPRPAVAILTIPQLTREQIADPIHLAAKYRVPLLNQVGVLAAPPSKARQQTVRSALHFINSEHSSLMDVARADLAALQAWRTNVAQAQAEFDDRYRKEYLTTARFRRFDEALVRLLELLELPGVGKVLSGTLYVLRTPYRWIRSLFTHAMGRPESATLPERLVLDQAFAGWVDGLRRDSMRREGTHPLWKHLTQAFAGPLQEQAKQRFEEAFKGFQINLADEVENTARAIYEDLEKNPVALNTLRGTKFTMEVASIAGTVAMGGISAIDVVLVPLAASLTHQLVELLGKSYVEHHRERTRSRQQALVTQFISGPLSDWFSNWPTSGGSHYERLQRVLRRLPENVLALDRQVRANLSDQGP